MTDREQSLLAATAHALEQLPLTPADQAARRLALLYARTIDDTNCWECAGRYRVLQDLGPKLLVLLDRLGATPASRQKLETDEQPSTGRATVHSLAALRDATRAP